MLNCLQSLVYQQLVLMLNWEMIIIIGGMEYSYSRMECIVYSLM